MKQAAVAAVVKTVMAVKQYLCVHRSCFGSQAIASVVQVAVQAPRVPNNTKKSNAPSAEGEQAVTSVTIFGKHAAS